MKIIINTCYGGFGFSDDAIDALRAKGIRVSPYCGEELRAHPDVVAIVESMGEKANGRHAQLKVVEIPDDIEYTIEEYDGIEWVAENHRTWE
jgi:hypothetical protein